MSVPAPFSDIRVLTLSDRAAAKGCGGLLAAVGAQVKTTQPSPYLPNALLVEDIPDALGQALEWADVVITCRNGEGASAPPPFGDNQIHCNIQPGLDGPCDSLAWNDWVLQAATGLTDLTGTAMSDPTLCEAPIVELMGSMYAASAILVAWAHRAQTGEGQSIEISLRECGLNALTSALPFALIGKDPKRSGNRHLMAAPWNAYQASDGWVLICAATDEQWRRLCAVLDRQDLIDGRFSSLVERVALAHDVDREVEAWTRTRSMKDCVIKLNAAGIAAGEIIALDALTREANLVHRRFFDAQGKISRRGFIAWYGWSEDAGAPQDRKSASPLSARLSDRNGERGLPLSGIKVVEVGQYTAAPLAARQLALLGATVVKVEPVGGEAARAWAPHQGGQGYFYSITNSNKQSIVLDLAGQEGRARFTDLLKQADVLVENLKPGSLERLGFGRDNLGALNPSLVYCGISGFGFDSAYPGRAAFDTVVQAMCGLMDATRVDGIPTKLGISASDITSGIAGLFAILAGLEHRRRTGRGIAIDLAMQEVGAWLNQGLAERRAPPSHVVIECRDGFIVVHGPANELPVSAEDYAGMGRYEAVTRCRKSGYIAAPVATLGELAAALAKDRGGPLHFETDAAGLKWPLFRSPISFSRLRTLAPTPVVFADASAAWGGEAPRSHRIASS